MGLLCTLRLFALRRLVASCPCPCPCPFPPFPAKFFAVPASPFQRHARSFQSVKNVHQDDGPLPLPAPPRNAPVGGAHQQNVHHATDSRASLKGDVFYSNDSSNGEDGGRRLDGSSSSSSKAGRWSTDATTSKRLDLPGDCEFPMLPASPKAMGDELDGKAAVAAAELFKGGSQSSFFGVTKEKLELRSQIVKTILHSISTLQDVTLIANVLSEWLRNFASSSSSRLDAPVTSAAAASTNLSYAERHSCKSSSSSSSSSSSLSSVRFVPYAQVARIIHSVMQDLGRSGQFEAALGVLRWMEGQGWCQLDPHMYTTIIAFLGEAGSFELAEQIFEELENSQVEKDRALLNAMLNTRGKAGQIDSLEDLFESMKRSSYKPDLVTYNTVMNSYVKAGMGLGTVVDVFRDMYSHGINPDLISFDILLQACVSGKHVKEAQKIFENLKRRGLRPSVVTYTTLISVYADSGDSGSAMRLLSEMVTENCQPNTRTFSSLITACGRDGNIEEAERLFKSMRRIGVEPNVVTYNAMIDMYAKAGNCDMALQKYKELELAGLKPTGFTISSVMSSLKAAEAYDEIRVLYEKAKVEALCNEHVFSAAIDSYIKWGKIQGIKVVQGDMVVAKCSPNAVTCSIVLAALGSKCSSAEDAAVLVNFLQAFDSGLAVNSCRMLLEQLSSDDEVRDIIRRLFSLLDKEELRTWTVFTCALVDALWVLGWHRRAAQVVAWVTEEGLFENVCFIHSREWKLDLRRLSWGTALVTLYQWLGHLVIVARHFDELKRSSSEDEVRSALSAEEMDATAVESAAAAAPAEFLGQLLGPVEREEPLNVEIIVPLAPLLPDVVASKSEFSCGKFPPLLTIVTGWGKFSKQEGSSLVRTSVQKEIMKLRAPFRPSLDSGRWMTTGNLLMQWLVSPGTASQLVLSDLASQVDSAQEPGS